MDLAKNGLRANIINFKFGIDGHVMASTGGTDSTWLLAENARIVPPCLCSEYGNNCGWFFSSDTNSMDIFYRRDWKEIIDGASVIASRKAFEENDAGKVVGLTDC